MYTLFEEQSPFACQSGHCVGSASTHAAPAAGAAGAPHDGSQLRRHIASMYSLFEAQSPFAFQSGHCPGSLSAHGAAAAAGWHLPHASAHVADM